MCRWLCEMLLIVKGFFRQFWIFIDTIDHYISTLFFLIAFHICQTETFKYNLRCRYRKTVIICSNFNRSCLIFCWLHSARHKTLPDQLIQTELVSCKRFFDFCRNTGNIWRTDGFVCILNIFSVIFLLLFRCSLCHILFSVGFSNIGSCICIRLLRNTGRIRTQVSDQTNRSTSFNIHTFIKLLCDTHRLWSCKIQCFGCLLLKGTGRKRKRCFFTSLSAFYIDHFIFCIFQICKNLMQFFFVMDGDLLILCSIEFCCKRLLFSLYLEIGVQWPVFFRNKRIDLIFSVTDDTKRNRLYAPRT